MKHAMNMMIPVSVIALASGCAQYQYHVVQPAEYAQVMTKRGEVIMTYDPLQYELTDRDANLGVRIHNLSDEPVVLVGEPSYVVDADGQTHSMVGGTIAPRSYIAFTLPPIVRVARSGPRFGIGVGVGGGSGGTFIGSGVGTTWDGTSSNYPNTFSNMQAWRWTTGDVRLHAEYDLDGERVAHDFLLRRERSN